MSEKIYKVKGDHLNALGEAAGIIVAFLESIKANDALLNFSAAQALLKLKGASEPSEKPAPHTHVCKCKGGKPVAVVCKTKCRKAVRKANAPVPLGEVARQLDKEEARKRKICGSGDIARELGKRVSTISHYATANNIGRLQGTVRVYNADEADMIRKHFGR